MVNYWAAKPQRFIIASIICIPELWWEQTVQPFLKLLPFWLPDECVHLFGKRWQHDAWSKEYCFFSQRPLQCQIFFINKLHKFISIVFLQGIFWEVFWNIPLVTDAILNNEVHVMRVMPDSLILDAEILLSRKSDLWSLSIVVPLLIDDLAQLLQFFKDHLVSICKHSEYSKWNHQEQTQNGKEVSVATESLHIQLNRIQTIDVIGLFLDSCDALVFTDWWSLCLLCVICVLRLVLAWLALSVWVIIFVLSYVTWATEHAAVTWEALRVMHGAVLSCSWSLEFEGHISCCSTSNIARSEPEVALFWLAAWQITLEIIHDEPTASTASSSVAGACATSGRNSTISFKILCSHLNWSSSTTSCSILIIIIYCSPLSVRRYGSILNVDCAWCCQPDYSASCSTGVFLSRPFLSISSSRAFISCFFTEVVWFWVTLLASCLHRRLGWLSASISTITAMGTTRTSTAAWLVSRCKASLSRASSTVCINTGILDFDIISTNSYSRSWKFWILNCDCAQRQEVDVPLLENWSLHSDCIMSSIVIVWQLLELILPIEVS